jgi:ubiquinone/menaquinone biosynthesis C-methylase UbiE
MVKRLLRSCGGRALDYGCGYGDIAFAVSSGFESIVGVDIDAERIAWAQAEFAPIQFQVCSKDGLEYEDASFETVLSIVVINWVPDPDQYLREITRVLSFGGKLVIAAKAPSRMRNRIRAILGQPEVKESFWDEHLEDMIVRLKKHGLEIEAVDCFWDPLSDSLRSWKEVLLAVLLLPMRLLRVAGYAPYYGIRARKVAV